MKILIPTARVAFITALALLFVTTAVFAEEQAKTPDATVKLSSTSFALGLGYAWGDGVLTYKGKEYRFRVKGLSAGAVGATSVDAAGDVYHLKDLADFAGTYAGFAAAATVGGGIDYSAIQNGSGVYIQLHGTSIGMLFQAGPEGINFVLNPEDMAAR
jgi:hypothetical protein